MRKACLRAQTQQAEADHDKDLLWHCGTEPAGHKACHAVFSSPNSNMLQWNPANQCARWYVQECTLSLNWEGILRG